MFDIVAGALTWIFRAAVIKFCLSIALFAVLAFLWPVLLLILDKTGFLSVSALDSALSSIPSGVMWFIGAFQFGSGLKIMLSAYATRFLIRRLPVIG